MIPMNGFLNSLAEISVYACLCVCLCTKKEVEQMLQKVNNW